MAQVNSTEMILNRITHIRRTLAGLGVRSLGVFGSFVRGAQPPSNDVDILIDFTPDKHAFDNFMDACALLEETFGRQVELVTRESLSPHIGPHILQEVQNVPIPA